MAFVLLYLFYLYERANLRRQGCEVNLRSSSNKKSSAATCCLTVFPFVNLQQLEGAGNGIDDFVFM